MNITSEIHGDLALASSYFFVSYAHSPPLAGTLQADPDRWVLQFFSDLTESVERLAGKPRLAPGLFDQTISLSSGWKASLRQALSAAEVFVPLLSPGYYTRSWPGREWSCFDQRLARAGLDSDEREQRFEPVLWIPLPSNQDGPGLRRALARGSGEPAYAENGLRAMLRLPPYLDSYRRIVGRLAERIVYLAESVPIAPSAAPALDEVAVPSTFLPAIGTERFVVYVAAPRLSELPAQLSTVGYGDQAIDWRAYPRDQNLPLAEYAVEVAEQLDFTVTVTGVKRPAVPFGSEPGIIIIDPRFAASPERLSLLAQVAKNLMPWVLPLLVLDQDADERVTGLADRIRTTFVQSLAHSETALRAIRGVRSLEEFVSLMPILVTEAERQFLRHGPVLRSARPQRFWPRLTVGPVMQPQNEENNG